MPIAAGIVLNPEHVAAVHGSGADFALAPRFNPDVIKVARSTRLPITLGV